MKYVLLNLVVTSFLIGCSSGNSFSSVNPNGGNDSGGSSGTGGFGGNDTAGTNSGGNSGSGGNSTICHNNSDCPTTQNECLIPICLPDNTCSFTAVAINSTCQSTGKCDGTGNCINCDNVTVGDCDSNLQNGCEANLQTDNTNCGSCSHSCAGGDCNSGKCQPFIVGTGYNTPTNIKADGANTYFAATDGVYKLTADTITRLTTWSANPAKAYDIDDSKLYYVSDLNIRAIPKDGSLGNTLVLIVNGGAVNSIVYMGLGSAKYLVFGQNTQYEKIDLTNSQGGYTNSQTNSGILVSYTNSSNWMVVYKTGSSIPYTANYIFTTTGSVPGQFFTDSIYTIKAYNQYVYASKIDSIVKRDATDNTTTETTILSNQSNVSTMAADDTNLYFSDSLANLIYKMDVSGGAATVAASDQQYVTSMAVSSGFVYWTTTDGKIVRLTRD